MHAVCVQWHGAVLVEALQTWWIAQISASSRVVLDAVQEQSSEFFVVEHDAGAAVDWILC